ncbi:cation:proton antiporter [Neoehrlichia mikurensis]|uniref:Monovalent cation/H+ antiporter complex subunit F n=1 Tax=Neoehrlichia mikurensis TaxID=89586 RepID=A0A9Q9BXH2_9RICK|nr:monovalent cation/H+ antiporter complex subunit F [Neoehrlichia mikurensis]QXK91837.1 cation:proton antiporter [Neoehrlichia mikurensis]QXK93050.1 cation:proton antiporter [Neoehrlichia mikurensis]QXK93528.1 cation:proton antiporter [Neoehrlichia mikurensis]UTO55516.1 monovalent cation/H+ antiporter complex subunit F [Neoehrlichia mikurensis]UTO56437.1 monovalent cation/H+ antiporter complex subunit F [Neoehrlichia mikurensis]
MVVFTAYGLLVCMLLMLVVIIQGHCIYNRILAANLFSTYTIVLIVVLSVIKDTLSFIDVALIYACINFIAIIGFMKFFLYDNF